MLLVYISSNKLISHKNKAIACLKDKKEESKTKQLFW